MNKPKQNPKLDAVRSAVRERGQQAPPSVPRQAFYNDNDRGSSSSYTDSDSRSDTGSYSEENDDFENPPAAVHAAIGQLMERVDILEEKVARLERAKARANREEKRERGSRADAATKPLLAS